MSIVSHKIIQGIAGLLQVEYSPDLEHQIVEKVLSLPNQLFIRLLVQLSFALNVEYNSLLNYFNTQIAPNIIQKSMHKFSAFQSPTKNSYAIQLTRCRARNRLRTGSLALSELKSTSRGMWQCM
ncbi:Hypothetical_protein [Hexamita inflata]|uniref:Hypothetical_protein n=1 Tax=Hexamita inflata TaxID=28002 RepID=A0AA86QA17_9EUKA|nr:Hypothetical protein HINF_LOCUS39882 [Hexamita inflata]